MQGSPAGPASEPEIAGRRALDLVCRLLNASDDPAGLDALAADLAVAFGAPVAGLASLDGGTAIVLARAGTAAGDSLRMPWTDDPSLPDRARAAPAALCIVRPRGGSLLLTAAAAPGETGWLVWVEDPHRSTWDPPLPAVLALAGQALARRLVPEGSRPRWAEQVDRIARQQRLESAAAVARRLAHDFGNILTGILGFSELSLTQNVQVDSALHRYLMEVYRGAQAGAAFTHQLRLFCRRHPVSPRAAVLPAVFREEETRVRQLWGEAPFQIEMQAELPPVTIDADLLRQVIAALLDNAREATGPTGNVQFSARQTRLTIDDCLDYYGDCRPGEYVEIEVADDGPGLAPDVRLQLFGDPFFSTKPRRRGLGLATVYGILHAHRGGIRLMPGPQCGVRARAVVPVAEQAGALPEAATGVGTSGEKVLVVDDDPRVLQFVASALERAGYRVQAVGSAGEALDRYEAAGTDPFRLVLSDVLMPEVNGVDLARRLRGRNPDVRVLFMSGHVGPDFPRQELEGWQFELLPKPFRVDGLLRAVRGALDRAPVRRAARPGGAGDGPMCSTSR
jgi:signal transduction histidine kinase/ActR/RegA family two-component response regulator